MTNSKEGERNEGSEHAVSRRVFVGGAVAGAVGLPSIASAATGDSFTAVRDGNWGDSATWESGNVPTAGSDVSIQSGVTVTVASEVTTRIKYLEVAGTLRHAPDRDSKLRAETIMTKPDSRYEVGTNSTPIQRGVTAQVEFIDEGPIDENEWPERKNKGLLVMGELEMTGAEKTPWTTLGRHPEAGDTSIELSAEPTNWNPGDDVVVPGVNPYGRGLEHEDEERTIASINGPTVTFDAPLDHDHVPPKSDLDSYVLNLTRNIVLSSENTDEHRRGHVMVMSTGTDVRYVRFVELGRTNKDQYLTNPVRNADSLPDGLDPNPAARYALHWHHTGIGANEPHRVEGAVVDGSPGWGIVNHHSYSHVTDSITYNVFGAGFVAEGGNERGSFKRNFALRSRGSGETIDSRSAGAHGGSPPIDDFGHAGHGFWLQSPLIEVTDNVAAGHRHQAFVWWLRPLLEGDLAEGTTIEDSRVTYWPNLPMKYADVDESLLEAIEEGRFSNKDDLMVETQKIPSTFAKLNTVSGNTAFGSAGGADFSRHNFKWKHEQFSEFNVLDDMTVFNVGPFVDESEETHEPNLPRHRASGHQGRGGSVGVSFRYTSNVSLTNSHIVGTGRENSVGVPFHDYLWTTTIDNCTIENWDWGVDTGEHRLTWVRDNTLRNNSYDVNWSFDNAGPAIVENNDLELVRYNLGANLKSSDVFEFNQGRGMSVDGRTVYVEESAREYVPFPDQDSLSSVNNLEYVFPDPSDTVGMTNTELQSEYGVSISGALMPDDAVSEPWLEGAFIDPAERRSPPETAQVDVTDADALGSWEKLSDPDTSDGSCLRWTGSGDGPASLEFDCAEGVYTIHARVRPVTWNGDTVSFRVDGGEWRDAEKLKTPAGFQWHDVSPNGGEPYEWQLSEGTHTVEFAAQNDGVRIDELFVSSNGEVLGAYGAPEPAPEPELESDQQPYTDHDLSRIEAEDFDIGGEGVAYHDTSDGNNGGAYRDTDVDIQESSDADGGYNLGWVEEGEWWEYTVEVPEDGDYSLVARLAGKNATTLDVAVDGTGVASIDVPNTGGWQTWQTVEAGTVSLSAGTNVIRLTANGSSFNVNWFGFRETDATAPSAPANLSASNLTDVSVELSWDGVSDPSGIDRYNVYRNGTKETETSSTGTAIEGLSPETTYEFAVTAVDGAGNESDASDTASVTTKPTPKTVKVTGGGASSFGDGTRIRYIVETSGTIESGGLLEAGDVFGGSKVAGKVSADGSDSDTFELVGGDVTDVSTWGGDVVVTVDGVEL